MHIYHRYPIYIYIGKHFYQPPGSTYAELLVEMIRYLEQPRGHRGSVSEAIDLKGGWKVGLVRNAPVRNGWFSERDYLWMPSD